MSLFIKTLDAYLGHHIQQVNQYKQFNQFNPKLNVVILYTLEVVSRYRDPQLQVATNYSHFAYVDAKHL